jgi:hypothetical protein
LVASRAGAGMSANWFGDAGVYETPTSSPVVSGPWLRLNVSRSDLLPAMTGKRVQVLALLQALCGRSNGPKPSQANHSKRDGPNHEVVPHAESTTLVSESATE